MFVLDMPIVEFPVYVELRTGDFAGFAVEKSNASREMAHMVIRSHEAPRSG